MKRKFILLLIIFKTCIVHAQFYGKFNYFAGASIGYQFPLGDFAKQANGGPSFRLGGQKLLNEKLSLGLDFSFSALGQDQFWDGDHRGDYDVNYKFASAQCKAAYYFDARDRDFHPYIALSFGYVYYRNRVDFSALSVGVNDEKRSITQHKVGLTPLIGFLYDLSDIWGVDVNLRYGFIPNFPNSVTMQNELGADYQYKLGFSKISLPELSIGLFYRF